MTLDLAELLNLARGAAMLHFIVFLRVGAAMSVIPAFGEMAVPQRVRLLLGLSFTLIVAPAVQPEVTAIRAPYWMLYGTEVVVGLAFGMAIRMMIMVLQIAGTIAAQATSLAQMFSGAGAEPQPVISALLTMSGLCLAVSLGLHVHVAEALIATYVTFPPGRLPVSGDFLQWAIERVSACFDLAFALSLPFTIGALIYNVALGIINRAMPQLMVAFVGAPALTAGGLVLLFAVTPVILRVWSDALVQVLQGPF